MGCGSSSLKGEKQADVTDSAPQPIKKVNTNFSTIDYDAAAQGRRDTTVGPLDTLRHKSEAPSSIPERPGSAVDPATATDPLQHNTGNTKANQSDFENKLPDHQHLTQDPVTRNAEPIEQREPYQDVTVSPVPPTTTNAFNNEDKLVQPQITSAATDKQGETTSSNMGLFSRSDKSLGGALETTNGTSRPALTAAKKKDSYLNSFSADEGASTSRSFGFEHDTPEEKEAFFAARSSTSSKRSDEDKPKKKSIYAKYQDLKRGSGTSGLSDEELKKYTGKTRAELDQYASTTPGVAGGQAAGSLTAGGTSGIGMAAGGGEGLGGWGTEAGKRPVVR